jgi:hypothetical protein
MQQRMYELLLTTNVSHILTWSSVVGCRGKKIRGRARVQRHGHGNSPWSLSCGTQDTVLDAPSDFRLF